MLNNSHYPLNQVNQILSATGDARDKYSESLIEATANAGHHFETPGRN